MIAIFVIACILLYLIIVASSVRWFFIIIALIIATIFLIKYLIKKNEIQQYNNKISNQCQNGDTFTMQHHCPVCTVTNIFTYPKGSQTGNQTIKCRKCGNYYTR